jgi:hypothetical protein
MAALDDDRAALADLTTEVTAVLDILAGQVAGGVSAADAEQLAADIRAQAQRIRDAVTPPPAPSATVAMAPPDGGTGV